MVLSSFNFNRVSNSEELSVLYSRSKKLIYKSFKLKNNNNLDIKMYFKIGFNFRYFNILFSEIELTTLNEMYIYLLFKIQC